MTKENIDQITQEMIDRMIYEGCPHTILEPDKTISILTNQSPRTDNKKHTNSKNESI